MLPRHELTDERSSVLPAVACAVLALVLRLAYVGLAAPEQQTPGIAFKYRACATLLTEGHGFYLQVGQAPVPLVDRLPGYVVLLAGMLLLGATTPAALLAAHAAVGSLQAAAASAAGGALAGRRGAWLAGLLVAGWPPLWKSDVQLVETGASGAALMALVAVALGAGSLGSATRAVTLALLATIAVTLRPDYLPIPILVAAWQVARDRAPRRRVTALALTLGLPLALCFAWAQRNARVADGAFVSVGLGTNLLAAIGESVHTEIPSFGDAAVARSEGHSGLYWPDPGQRDRARVRRALDLIAEHPGAYLQGGVRRVAVSLSMHPGRLWPGPTAEEEIRAWRERHPGRGRYEGLFAAVVGHVARHPVSALLTFAWAPLALGLAALGAWRLRQRAACVVALLGLPAYAVLVHVPLHAEPRYFFPFIPMLLVVGAAGLATRSRPRAPDAA